MEILAHHRELAALALKAKVDSVIKKPKNEIEIRRNLVKTFLVYLSCCGIETVCEYTTALREIAEEKVKSMQSIVCELSDCEELLLKYNPQFEDCLSDIMENLWKLDSEFQMFCEKMKELQEERKKKLEK